MGYPAFIVGSDTEPAETHWTELPAGLKEELLNYIDHYHAPSAGELDGVCFWLDQQTQMCKHHEHRPNVCRDFQVGGKDCLAWRKHYRERIQTGE